MTRCVKNHHFSSKVRFSIIMKLSLLKNLHFSPKLGFAAKIMLSLKKPSFLRQIPFSGKVKLHLFKSPSFFTQHRIFSKLSFSLHT
mmetsp:Transcript_38188/g.50306  ORF Transcript_38188/g.50306 Transcript_38188/m.50306 type:complete len:86 (-) Transcript_38188:374-631(-)